MTRRLRDLLVIRYKIAFRSFSFCLFFFFFLEGEGEEEGELEANARGVIFFHFFSFSFNLFANIKRLSIRKLSQNYNTARSLQHLW